MADELKRTLTAKEMEYEGWLRESATSPALEEVAANITNGTYERVRTITGNERWSETEFTILSTYEVIYRYEHLEALVSGAWVRVARRRETVSRRCIYSD